MVKVIEKPNGKRRKTAKKWLDEKPGKKLKAERRRREEERERMEFLKKPLTHNPFECLEEVKS